MATTDYPYTTQYPPEKYPELWGTCEKCGLVNKAPADYTGDMCHCPEEEQGG